MTTSPKTITYRVFLLVMTAVLAISGLGLAFSPAVAQGMDLNQCGMLYAVQQGDTAETIAERFNTSVDDLSIQNTWMNENGQSGQSDSQQGAQADQLFPGRVICISPEIVAGMRQTGQSNQSGQGQSGSTGQSGQSGQSGSTGQSDSTGPSGQQGQNAQVGSVDWASCDALYAVQEGDTAASIAERFSMAENDLAFQNPWLNQNGQGQGENQDDASQQGQAVQQGQIFPGLVLCVSMNGQADQSGQSNQSGQTGQSGSTAQSGQSGQSGSTGQTGQSGQNGGTGQQGQSAQQGPDTQSDQQVQQSSTISLGNAGVFSPYGFSDANVSADKISEQEAGFAPVKFLMPLVRINGEQTTFPNVMTYVYFNVKNRDFQNSEQLSIWYKTDGQWQQCGTTFVVDQDQSQSSQQNNQQSENQTQGQSRENNRNQPETRIACVVPQYNAIYGVGISR